MSYQIAEYTFAGLLNNDMRNSKTVAYLVALVDSPQNIITNLDKAKFALRLLFDIEEQVESASELLSRQENMCFPSGYYPQTPVMVALEWSPMSEMLERDWQPVFLTRESKRRSCASGIWEARLIDAYKPYEECKTPEELFWHILGKVAPKAVDRELLISIIAMPGWGYYDNIGRPDNLTLAEAEKADRVIWQRTSSQ